MKSMLPILAAAAVFAAPVVIDPAQARMLSLENPDDALAMFRKMQCSLTDNEPTFFHWSGKAYSKREGERDTLLFNLEGMNVRQCVTVNDPEKGKGFRLVTREIMLYLDPKTGEVLRTWKNPVTGDEVDVLHVANDPVNQRPFFSTGRNGEPFSLPGRISKGMYLGASEVPLYYKDPLGGDYQDQVGGHYHAMEMFNFIVNAKDLQDSKVPNALTTAVSWVRVSSWLPWMNMGSRPGILIFNTTGQKLASFEDYPEVLKTEIRANYPVYTAPPPGDDTRPNETSWTVYKKWAETHNKPKADSGSGH